MNPRLALLLIAVSTFTLAAKSLSALTINATPGASLPSFSDLINTDSDTLLAATYSAADGGLGSNLNDGTEELAAYNAADGHFPVEGTFDPTFPGVNTFDLDLSTNTAGYSITSIVTRSGAFIPPGDFTDRAHQAYDISVSLVGSPLYIDLGSVDVISTTTAMTVNITADTLGPLATSVDSLRFSLRQPDASPVGVVIQEIDVFGRPTQGSIPEPSAVVLAAAGLLCGIRPKRSAR